jgi:hypothetical protein
MKIYGTPSARQRNLKTPTTFLCYPKTIEGDPIECYLSNLSEGSLFAKNQYGEIFTMKCAAINNKAIVVITESPDGLKPYGLIKITYEYGDYVHAALGTFFSLEGAEKQFTLAQGLEWTGGDSIDDYC